MNTKTVSTAEFIRHFGRYHDEAQTRPIALTKHGRASVVVLSAAKFEQLLSGQDPRRAFGHGETPADLAEILLAGIDEQSSAYLAGKDE